MKIGDKVKFIIDGCVRIGTITGTESGQKLTIAANHTTYVIPKNYVSVVRPRISLWLNEEALKHNVIVTTSIRDLFNNPSGYYVRTKRPSSKKGWVNIVEKPYKKRG